MKNSIAYLPKAKQDDLYYILSLIHEHLPQAEMVILFGSYARNSYVDYDERIEFGIPTSYRSDYDILVVTSGIADWKAEDRLQKVGDLYYRCPESQTPVQFIHDGIKKVNSDLSEGRYFYTEIKRDGVMLYDSGNFKLVRRRKLRYDEIRQQAEGYFEDKFRSVAEFMLLAKFSYEQGLYKKASFLLHQVCENAYCAIQLVYTLKNSKLHDLEKLSKAVRKHSPDLVTVFPRNTKEEKRLFSLIKAAYVEARYNSEFKVTKEDIDALMPKAELLRDITQRICLGKIGEFGEKAAVDRDSSSVL